MIVHRCPARHYVFSSRRGYRTLFASPDLPHEMVNALEGYAGRVYQRAGAEPEYDVFELSGGPLCIAKRFQAGADHVGRPRNCVHTVLLEKTDVAAIPGFNPFFVLLQDAGFFLGTDFESGAIEEKLPRAFLCSEKEFSGLLEMLENSGHSKSRLRAGLSALLSGKPAVVIRAGDTVEAGKLVAFLSLLLPPRVRSRISMVGTSDLAGIATEDKTVVFIRRRSDSIDEFLARKTPALDFTSASIYNVHKPSMFAMHALKALSSIEGIPGLKKLLALMERFPGHSHESEGKFGNFLEGFSCVSKIIGQQGNILVAANPQAALEGARLFYRSGHVEIAFDIIHQAAAIALDPETSTIRPVMRERDLKSLIDTLQRIVPDNNDSTAFDVEISPSAKRKPPTLFFERPAPGDIAEWDD